MFEVLSEEAVEQFVSKYFKEWGHDIWKVTKISYKDIDEYLINEHYLFRVQNK